MKIITDFEVEAETILRKASHEAALLVQCIDDDIADGGTSMEDLNLMVSTIRCTIEDLDYHSDDLRKLYNSWYQTHLDKEDKLAGRAWAAERVVS
jgi:hypothetical protein